LATPLTSEWKREANHRLAAHRARRGNQTMLQSAFPGMEESTRTSERRSPGNDPRSAVKSVADRVAARYAQAPTYSEMLAAEARNAARAAAAAAVAAGEARDAAQAILVGLDIDRNEDVDAQSQTRDSRHTAQPAARIPEIAPPVGPHLAIAEAAEEELVEETLPDEPIAPIQPLPAKLLEFPRELVAARKARPRLAEGPLREDYDTAVSQLRIFEVEPETISTEPVIEPMLPGWSAIRLDTPAEVRPDSDTQQNSDHDPRGTRQHHSPANAAAGFDLPLQTATLEDRLMAGTVDAALIVAGFLVFLLVFAGCTAHPPTGNAALIGAALIFLAFALFYQLLFFSFGHDTPGMRYAKIALCTFNDENPSREAMRRRIGAVLLSASPLGLGILWAFFDDDRLGWHDRISRTYQRSYR
jgi:uncharacterized RDD family membrane protein YckC